MSLYRKEIKKLYLLVLEEPLAGRKSQIPPPIKYFCVPAVGACKKNRQMHLHFPLLYFFLLGNRCIEILMLEG